MLNERPDADAAKGDSGHVASVRHGLVGVEVSAASRPAKSRCESRCEHYRLHFQSDFMFIQRREIFVTWKLFSTPPKKWLLGIHA